MSHPTYNLKTVREVLRPMLQQMIEREERVQAVDPEAEDRWDVVTLIAELMENPDMAVRLLSVGIEKINSEPDTGLRSWLYEHRQLPAKIRILNRSLRSTPP